MAREVSPWLLSLTTHAGRAPHLDGTVQFLRHPDARERVVHDQRHTSPG